MNLSKYDSHWSKVKNNHDLLYSQIFMHWFSRLYLPNFSPKSFELSMNSHVLALSQI